MTGRTTIGCNAGTDAATYVTDFFVLRRMIEDGYKPRMLIYVINDQLLGPTGPDPQEAVNSLWLAGIQDADLVQPPLGGTPSGLLARTNFYALKLIPLYRDRIGLLNATTTAVLREICNRQPASDPCHFLYVAGPLAQPNGIVVQPADHQGWVALTGTSLATLGPQKVAQYWPPCGASCPAWTVDEQGGEAGREVQYLNDTLALARANHIAVALVISPRPAVYFAHFYGTSANWARVPTFCQTLAQTYGAAFYDASHAPGYTSADFTDYWHLNAEGAAAFSRWLGTTVVAPLLATGGAGG